MTDWQRSVAEFAHRYSLLHGPVIHALDLVSEVGEVAKEVLLGTDYGQRALQSRPRLADELGDALYSLLVLAEACGVDAGDALDAALDRYECRLTERGKAGSI
jgi:NTP pyrophosphatase (non-canonical NTP hydrolase)